MELYTHTDTNTGCIYTSIHLYLTLSLSLSHTHKRNLISFEFLDRIEEKGNYWRKDIPSVHLIQGPRCMVIGLFLQKLEF